VLGGVVAVQALNKPNLPGGVQSLGQVVASSPAAGSQISFPHLLQLHCAPGTVEFWVIGVMLFAGTHVPAGKSKRLHVSGMQASAVLLQSAPELFPLQKEFKADILGREMILIPKTETIKSRLGNRTHAKKL
jgi:hypothetical protein